MRYTDIRYRKTNKAYELFNTNSNKNKKKYLNVTARFLFLNFTCYSSPATRLQAIPTRYLSCLLVVVASSPTCFAAQGARRWKRTSVTPEKDDMPAELRDSKIDCILEGKGLGLTV